MLWILKMPACDAMPSCQSQPFVPSIGQLGASLCFQSGYLLPRFDLTMCYKHKSHGLQCPVCLTDLILSKSTPTLEHLPSLRHRWFTPILAEPEVLLNCSCDCRSMASEATTAYVGNHLSTEGIRAPESFQTCRPL